LTTAFWNLFSGDYARNCLSWKHEAEPILPPSGDGWQSTWTANPDLLQFGDRLLLFYRGHGVLPGRETMHDRIGVSEVLSIGFGTLELSSLAGGQPVVDVGPEGSFDGQDVLDPATVMFQGRVLLYYSALGNGPDSVGLAVSDDGINFEKIGKVLVGRAPDVIELNGTLFMVYQREDEHKNYRIYLASSSDGYEWTDVQRAPIFQREEESWDSLSVATVRLSKDGEWIYAIYGGSSYLADEPEYFGLARTKDLLTWEFHVGNPIFGCGAKGLPDGGAMWFPALADVPGGYVMLFEGSRGKCAWDLSSSICMASIKCP
jgi:predicted GH43/DUF377 family glycosyl hydrolase